MTRARRRLLRRRGRHFAADYARRFEHPESRGPRFVWREFGAFVGRWADAYAPTFLARAAEMRVFVRSAARAAGLYGRRHL